MTSPIPRTLVSLCMQLLALALSTTLVAQTVSPDGNPRNGEVPLPCADGWNAFCVWDTEGPGVWTLANLQVRPEFGCPEIVALDDDGRCTVLVSYSGKWTPNHTVHAGTWLGALQQGDLDPTADGPELYVGGKNGSVYQVVSVENAKFDDREIAHFADEEVHMLALGDYWPERDGDELVVFARSGRVEVLRHTRDGAFERHVCGKMPGRVRHVLPYGEDASGRPRMVTASRAQEVALVTIAADGSLQREPILRASMGFGRLSLGTGPFENVIYASRDDGLVVRIERNEHGWSTSPIYAGPQGLRGIVAGRFTDDPEEETVAVFGYSAKVQLLRRKPGAEWTVETLFVEKDRGHWLSRAEVDGRNGTDELIASGYAGRVILLSRPPGYGMPGVATDPDDAPRTDTERRGREQANGGPTSGNDAVNDGAIRLAMRASQKARERLSPLSYRGGFETKTLLYETLVRRDEAGRIAPGLASSWQISTDGTEFTFAIRSDAVFHDGEAVTANAVVEHFRRWVGHREHDWLGCNDRIREVVASDPQHVVVRLHEPYALLPELCAINPCAIQAPGSRDREGEFVRPVGSGPFAFVGFREDGQVMRLRRFTAGSDDADNDTLDLVLLARDRSPFAAVVAGEADAAIGSHLVEIDPADARSLLGDDRFRICDAPGSSVHYLSFSLTGPTADRAVRTRIASAIDRAALIEQAFAGYADPAFAWAAPGVRTWPAHATRPVDAAAQTARFDGRTLRLLAPADDPLARAVVAQLVTAGVPVVLDATSGAERARRVRAREFDLRIESTWGVPYDPFLSLRARFVPRRDETATAASDRAHAVPTRLQRLVERASRCAHEDERLAAYAEVQSELDRNAWIVPLLAPRRVSVSTAALDVPAQSIDLYRIAPATMPSQEPTK